MSDEESTCYDRKDLFAFALIGLVLGLGLAVVLLHAFHLHPDDVCNNDCRARHHDRGEYELDKHVPGDGHCLCFDQDESE